MKRILPPLLLLIINLSYPQAVAADNCSGLSDCFRGNVMPALWLILGLLALAVIGWYLWPLVARFALGPALRLLSSTAARSRIAQGIGRFMGRFIRPRSLRFAARQVQKKWKHAKDFGIKGNFNRANQQAFQNSLRQHVNNKGTQIIQGTYRGQNVTHYYNPNTGLNVVRDANGNFLSGWKLSPSQIRHLLESGRLGGG